MTKQTQSMSNKPSVDTEVTGLKWSDVSSTISCCGGCLLMLPMLLTLGFLAFKYWSFVIPVISSRLHIPMVLALIVFVLGTLNFSYKNGDVEKRWGLEYLNFPLYRVNKQVSLGINLIGGVLPLLLAFYQLLYVPVMPVISVMAVVTLLCYFSVIVSPMRCISSVPGQILLISLMAALVAKMAIAPSPLRLDSSIAFAGSALGALIGADLLHIKDLKVKEATVPLIIGGAGFNDGILKTGLISLFTAEWFPYVVKALRARYTVAISDDSLVLALMAGTLCLLCVYKLLFGFFLSRVLSPLMSALFKKINLSRAQTGQSQQS